MKRALCTACSVSRVLRLCEDERRKRAPRACCIYSCLYLWPGAATAAKAELAGDYVAPTCRWMLRYCGFVILKFGGNKSSPGRNGRSVHRALSLSARGRSQRSPSRRRSKQWADEDYKSRSVWTFVAYRAEFRPGTKSPAGCYEPFPDLESIEGLGAREKSWLKYHQTRQLTITSFEQQ